MPEMPLSAFELDPKTQECLYWTWSLQTAYNLHSAETEPNHCFTFEASRIELYFKPQIMWFHLYWYQLWVNVFCSENCNDLNSRIKCMINNGSSLQFIHVFPKSFVCVFYLSFWCRFPGVLVIISSRPNCWPLENSRCSRPLTAQR